MSRSYPNRGNARRDRLPHEYLWSERDVRVLRSCWPRVGVIALRLHRSRKAVRMKARALGLPPPRKVARPWTDEDRQDAIFSPDPIKEIASRLGRTVTAVKVLRNKHRKSR